MRAINRLGEQKWRAGWSPRPLDAEDIIGVARRRARLSDFDGDEWREPLRILTESWEGEAGLTPLGRILVRQGAIRNLTERLRIVGALKQNPSIRNCQIDRPLFVVGMPRTGTTLLLNLLAQVPMSRPLLGWEAAQPIPPRRIKEGAPDPRIRRFAAVVRGFKYMAPEFETVHPLSVEGPEEDLALLQRTFQSWAYLAGARLPSYERWLWAQDADRLALGYQFYRRQLQFLQWQRPGRYWVLKSPAHINTLEGLLKAFPSACVVQTHRHMSEVVPSACSLFLVGRSFTSRPDPHALGQELLASTAKTLRRLLEVRTRIAPERILDVHFDETMADPAGVVRRIHAHFGYPALFDIDERITEYLSVNRRHKHGAHRYSLEQFGIDREELLDLAGAYHERFGVRRE